MLFFQDCASSHSAYGWRALTNARDRSKAVQFLLGLIPQISENFYFIPNLGCINTY